MPPDIDTVCTVTNIHFAIAMRGFLVFMRGTRFSCVCVMCCVMSNAVCARISHQACIFTVDLFAESRAWNACVRIYSLLVFLYLVFEIFVRFEARIERVRERYACDVRGASIFMAKQHSTHGRTVRAICGAKYASYARCGRAFFGVGSTETSVVCVCTRSFAYICYRDARRCETDDRETCA